MRKISLLALIMSMTIAVSSCQIYSNCLTNKMTKSVKLEKSKKRSLKHYSNTDYIGYIDFVDFYAVFTTYIDLFSVPSNFLIDREGNVFDLAYNPDGEDYCASGEHFVLRDFSPDTPKKFMPKEDAAIIMDFISKTKYWSEPFDFGNMGDYDFVLFQCAFSNMLHFRKKLKQTFKEVSENEHYNIATVYVNLNYSGQ